MRRRLRVSSVLVSMVALVTLSAQSSGMVEARVDVELSCPSCAQGLERRLGRVDQVAAVAVRADDGQIVVTPEPGTAIDLIEIRDAVRNAGFIPDAIHVTAVGVVGGKEMPELELPNGAVLRLKAGDAMVPASGRTVRLSGVVEFVGRGEPPVLLVHTVDAS